VTPITKPLDAASRSARETHHFALPIVGFGVAVALLYFGRILFITSIAAVFIALMLEPFVALLVRVRFPRSLASFVVCTVALLLLYVIGLGAYSQISGLYQDLPRYGQRIGDLVDDVRQRIQGVEEQTYRTLLPARQRQKEEERQKAQQAARGTRKGKRADAAAQVPATAPPDQPVSQDEQSPISTYLLAKIGVFYQSVLMASFIPFLVYFMLSWRDHINRSFLQFFQGEDRIVAARSLSGIAGMARAFVVGNFLLGILLAILSTLIFWLIPLPYPMLVGPLSGFLSLIPYVGLPLAMLPPLFAALGANSLPVYVLSVTSVAALHLVALNLLYPKIVGSRVHLNPLVVTFSLMFWGFLWDAAGLVLAIPLTAALKAVCDNVKRLRPIGKFLGD
jgi:predicted PurR-regulated permease PerM